MCRQLTLALLPLAVIFAACGEEDPPGDQSLPASTASYPPDAPFTGPYLSLTPAELRTLTRDLLAAHLTRGLRIGDAIFDDTFLVTELSLPDLLICPSVDCAVDATKWSGDIVDQAFPSGKESGSTADTARFVHTVTPMVGDPIEYVFTLRSPLEGTIDLQVQTTNPARTLFHGRMTDTSLSARGDAAPARALLELTTLLDRLQDAESIVRLAGTFELSLDWNAEDGGRMSLRMGTDVDVALGYMEGLATWKPTDELTLSATADADGSKASLSLRVPDATGAVPTAVVHREFHPTCASANYACEGGTPGFLDLLFSRFFILGEYDTKNRSFGTSFIPSAERMVQVLSGTKTVAELASTGFDTGLQPYDDRYDLEVVPAVTARFSATLENLVEDVPAIWKSGLELEGSYTGADDGRVEIDRMPMTAASGQTPFAKMDGPLTLRSSDGRTVEVAPGQCLTAWNTTRLPNPNHPFSHLSSGSCRP